MAQGQRRGSEQVEEGGQRQEDARGVGLYGML